MYAVRQVFLEELWDQRETLKPKTQLRRCTDFFNCHSLGAHTLTSKPAVSEVERPQ